MCDDILPLGLFDACIILGHISYWISIPYFIETNMTHFQSITRHLLLHNLIFVLCPWAVYLYKRIRYGQTRV